MPIDTQLADRCIDLLNEALALDPAAISDLFNFRSMCNWDLASHRSIQCDNSVGVLGILNGLCGTFDDGPRKGWGPITAVVANPVSRRIIRFERTDDFTAAPGRETQ